MTMPGPASPLQALAQALRRTARFNRDVECAPHCILWPDIDIQFYSDAKDCLLKAIQDWIGRTMSRADEICSEHRFCVVLQRIEGI